MKKWTIVATLGSVVLVACGGGGSDTKNRAPSAGGGTLTLDEDAAATIVAVSASDPDGDALAIALEAAPTKGTAQVEGTSGSLSFRYTPAPNANGADQFTYRVTDPDGLFSVGTVIVTITARPDAPTAPAANLATEEDAAGSVSVTAADADGDALTAAVTVMPARGTVTVSGNNPFTLTFTPTPDANGADSFTYRVTDPAGNAATATVNVSIAPQPDAPAIAALTVQTNEDVGANGVIPASDADGDPLTLSVLTPPQHGALQLNGAIYTYSPQANYFGTDGFVVRASDGTLQSAATAVPINVGPVNDAPVAVDDAFLVAAAGPTSLDVLGNDTDIEGDALTVETAAQTAGITASVVGNRLRVTPTPGFNGPTEISYVARDAQGATSTGHARLVVGSAAPLFLLTGGNGAPRRIYRHDYLAPPMLLDTPVPDGERLERFTTSVNGSILVYATRTVQAPTRDRLWIRSLDDTSAPVAEITTDASYVTNYLRLSPDGTLVVFNDRYAATSVPSISREVEPGQTIRNPTFTRAGTRLFYSVLQPGGGFVIKRADVPLTGILANRAQMTANYPAGEGLGSEFRLTPDETRILSTGMRFVGGAVNAVKQHAFVTTANGSQDDAQLHPSFVGPFDGAGLPLSTPDSTHAFYVSVINRLSIAGSTELAAPGTVTTIGSTVNQIGDLRVAGDSQTVFFTTDGILPVNWQRGLIGNFGSIVAFQPTGGGSAAPRVVEPAPDGSAVVFDSGASIYGLLGGQYLVPTRLFDRTEMTKPLIHYAPDSSSIVISNPLENGLAILNPKSPGWYEAFAPGGASPTGASCVAYAGEDC